MSAQQTIIVGMSGGVDSSVSALLLKQQGYQVIGLFMKNWEESDEWGRCKAADDYDDVRRVCDSLAIPHYTMNFAQEYQKAVFEKCIADFKIGLTPNPDILCNREIKFKVFFEKAMELGASFLATGHYCQNKNATLVKGKDPNKDQTYFLYAINRSVLPKVLFPIGDLIKPHVRQIAQQHQLITANKKDSTGICFIGKRDFREFLSQYVSTTPGNFETLDGKIVGKHMGTAFYTLGQRKGLAIGGAGEAWFVVGKDLVHNVVIVIQGSDHPALYCDELRATQLNWLITSPTLPYKCQAKVRYRQTDQPCTIYQDKDDSNMVKVVFDQPQRAVTPGQSIVFYDGEICMGGGIIKNTGPSYYHMHKALCD